MTAAATASPIGPPMWPPIRWTKYVADALAVMDATDAGQAILVGLSFGGLSRMRPRRAPSRARQGAVLAGTVASIGPSFPVPEPEAFPGEARTAPRAGTSIIASYWLADYPDFAEHFVRNIFSEPHSTKQIEDGIAWANETTGPVLIKTVEARAISPQFDVSEAMYRKIRCPLLVIHGDNDQIQPYARGKLVAELTGGELVTIPGGGHDPLGRYPAKCNALIIDFLDRRLGIRTPRSRRQRARRADSQAALYLSSPIGLGHGAARYRHRARTAQAAPRPAGRLAGAGSGHAPARGQRRARPSAERAARQRDRGTSSWNRASTSCTASRPSAAWTRC